MLKALPDTLDHTQQELDLQITLGPALMVTKGLAAPEAENVYARARELCQKGGDPPQLFPVLAGLINFYELRGEHQTARELAEQFLGLAERIQDPALLLEAHHLLGSPLYSLGELASAHMHLKEGVTLYNFQQHGSHAFLYGGHDPGVCCLSEDASALWLLGYPDQALRRSHDALTLSQTLPQLFSRAHALDFAAVLHQLRREGQTTQKRSEAAISLSIDQGFPLWLAWGMALRGWALAEQGEAGITQVRQGTAAWRATGAEAWLPYWLSLLGEVYGKAGQTKEGLSALAEALAVGEKSGGRWYEAETYRLKGELLLGKQKSKSKSQKSENTEPRPLTPDPQGEAEGCFLKAIEVARKQQAKSLELRATVSLARLWQPQGKVAEAHRILSEVYNWFTEGFDTADLQEAKALLEELGP